MSQPCTLGCQQDLSNSLCVSPGPIHFCADSLWVQTWLQSKWERIEGNQAIQVKQNTMVPSVKRWIISWALLLSTPTLDPAIKPLNFPYISFWVSSISSLEDTLSSHLILQFVSLREGKSTIGISNIHIQSRGFYRNEQSIPLLSILVKDVHHLLQASQ